MAENTASGSAVSADPTRGLPYYEKLKKDLRETLQKKRLLDKNMVSHIQRWFAFAPSDSLANRCRQHLKIKYIAMKHLISKRRAPETLSKASTIISRALQPQALQLPIQVAGQVLDEKVRLLKEIESSVGARLAS